MAYIEYTCVCLVYTRDVHHHNQHYVLQFKERLIAADVCKSEISSSDALSSLKKLREKLTFHVFCALCLLCALRQLIHDDHNLSHGLAWETALSPPPAHLAPSACVFLHSGKVTISPVQTPESVHTASRGKLRGLRHLPSNLPHPWHSWQHY